MKKILFIGAIILMFLAAGCGGGKYADAPADRFEEAWPSLEWYASYDDLLEYYQIDSGDLVYETTYSYDGYDHTVYSWQNSSSGGLLFGLANDQLLFKGGYFDNGGYDIYAFLKEEFIKDYGEPDFDSYDEDGGANVTGWYDVYGAKLHKLELYSNDLVWVYSLY